MAGDATKVASKHYKVLFENPHVRVIEYRSKPGEKSEMHSHPALVAVAVSHTKANFTFPDGKVVPVDLPPGHAMYNPSFDHAVENTGTGPGHVVIVELKGVK